MLLFLIDKSLFLQGQSIEFVSICGLFFFFNSKTQIRVSGGYVAVLFYLGFYYTYGEWESAFSNTVLE